VAPTSAGSIVIFITPRIVNRAESLASRGRLTRGRPRRARRRREVGGARERFGDGRRHGLEVEPAPVDVPGREPHHPVALLDVTRSQRVCAAPRARTGPGVRG
jgi:hypothetical protein